MQLYNMNLITYNNIFVYVTCAVRPKNSIVFKPPLKKTPNEKVKDYDTTNCVLRVFFLTF